MNWDDSTQVRKQLDETQRKQRERFAEDFARIFAAEQGPLEPDEQITDYAKVRGQ